MIWDVKIQHLQSPARVALVLKNGRKSYRRARFSGDSAVCVFRLKSPLIVNAWVRIAFRGIGVTIIG
jgi:hypothetical protein